MSKYTAPPASKDAKEFQRVTHTSLRRRMLYGEHEQDVTNKLIDTVGATRKNAWGRVNLSTNIFVRVYEELAGLYLRNPLVFPPEGQEEVASAISESGYWTLMQRIQRDTLALRTCAVHVSISDKGMPRYRQVFPDMLYVEVDKSNKPYLVKEWQYDLEREKWIRVCTDSKAGLYYVLDDRGNDISLEILGGEFNGEDYPWKDVEGGYLMPYVFYHAQKTSWFWDAYTSIEIVEGALNTMMHYTFYDHVVRDASWPQRYASGLAPAGLSEDGVSEVVTDPATLLILNKLEGYDGQPLIGQWSTSMDPKVLLDAIMQDERRIIESALGTASVARTSSEIQSGYSLAVSREQRRQAQRKYVPQFKDGDIEICKLTASLMGFEEAHWNIRYQSLPKDPEEVQATWNVVSSLLDSGLMSRKQAYLRLNPDLTIEEAERELELIDIENMLNNSAEGVQSTNQSFTSDTTIGLDSSQVSEALEVVKSVAKKELPRESGIMMLKAFFHLDEGAAEELMGTAGLSFEPSN